MRMHAMTPKHLLRDALLRARNEGHKYADIARALGYDARFLYDLIGKNNTITYERAHLLEKWLQSHGYLEGAAPSEPDKPPGIVEAMAKDLDALAAQLRSPLPNETKARLFAERVTFWYKSMQEYLKKVKES